MKIFDSGHCYKLSTYDGDMEQWLFFMHRIGNDYPGNQGEPYSGTNCQEVIRVLIDRVKYLEEQKPCSENKIILAYLRGALLQFEIRAARRHKRLLPQMQREIELVASCNVCGHLYCEHLS